MPHLQITDVALVHCNTDNNDYQQDSRFLHAFIRNKSFGHLLDILSNFFYFYNPLIASFHILMYGLLIKILNL